MCPIAQRVIEKEEGEESRMTYGEVCRRVEEKKERRIDVHFPQRRPYASEVLSDVSQQGAHLAAVGPPLYQSKRQTKKREGSR